MVITLGNIVFGGKGNGGSSTASAYVVPDEMSFGSSTLTEFPTDGLDFSQKTNFDHCWYYCSSLTSFPLLDLSSGTNFSYAWRGCSSLTSFPLLDLSSGTNFANAWYNCESLTTFPMLNLSKGTNFYYAWSNNPRLTSLPQLDLSQGTDFSSAWRNCPNLTNLGGFGAIKESIDLHWSTLLTAESIMNVITQAADLNELGLSSRTMTLGSTNLAKLTDEQKAVATNKGWTLA